jgi:beta-galactosidase
LRSILDRILILGSNHNDSDLVVEVLMKTVRIIEHANTRRWLIIILTAALLPVLPLTIFSQEPRPDRYKTFLFGVDYYPEHWEESQWEQDARRMQECGVNIVRIGEFGWSLMEPQEGKYDFSLFDRAIAVLAKRGIRIILGTPTATPPKWLTHNYPEVLNAFPNGQRMNDQTRRHASYISPVYRQFSRRVVEAMASHYKGNPNVIGWQIDNEFNNEDRECYSEACRVAFRQWLKNRYLSLDQLNQRWGTRFWSQHYTDWEHIDLPLPSSSLHHPALMLDYKRFISDSVTSFMEEQIEIIRRHRPNDFITHNGMFRNIDYYKFARSLDIHSYSNYPTFDTNPQYSTGARMTMLRGFNGRFMIMEQLTGPAGQTYLLRTPHPGEMNLWAWQTIAHGSEGVVHFRWRSARRGVEEYWYGVLDHDDVPRARYQEFKKEGLEIRKIGQELLGSKVVSDIAVIHDFEAEWVFDYQYLSGAVRIGSATNELFRAAQEMKFNLDIIGTQADFRPYKLIFAPNLVMMDEELAGKIRRFVEDGGTFVMGAHSAVKDRDNAMTNQTIPIMGLSKLFGVELELFQTYQPQSGGPTREGLYLPPTVEKNFLKFGDGVSVPVNYFAEILKVKGAQILATWERNYMQGAPACTENRVGKGKAVYYGSFLNADAARYLMQRYARELRFTPLIAGLPKELEVTRRTKGNNNYYFILNHANADVTVQLGSGYRDMLAGKEAPAGITLKSSEYRILKK